MGKDGKKKTRANLKSGSKMSVEQPFFGQKSDKMAEENSSEPEVVCQECR
jgi:hypothetical protein